MSHQRSVRELIATGRIDVTLAWIGVVLSVLLLGLQFLAYQPLIIVIPVSTGTACVLYLATQRRQLSTLSFPAAGRLAAGYLPAAVLFGLAGFVTLVFQAGARTGPAYLLAGLVGSAILLQILLVDDEWLDARLVLGQILLAAVVVRLAGLLVTPGFVGVDVWTHLPVFVQGIVDTGSFAPLEGSKYLLAPLYHSFAAIGTLLFGSTRMAVYLTLGLLLPLSVLFVYGTGTLVLPARWALLAAALYAYAEQFIEWGMHIIPTSLGLVFFLGVFYLVTRVFLDDAEWWAVGLLAVLSLALVVTHQVSTAITLVFLGIAAVVALSADVSRGWPFSASLGRSTFALGGIFGVTTVTTVVLWSMAPHGEDSIFLWESIRTALRLFDQQAGFLNLAGGGLPAYAQAESASLVDLLVPYVELLGFGMVLCLAVVGGLVLFRWDRPVEVNATYQLAAIVFFVATFGFSLFGFRAFLPGRWMAFLYVPLVLVGAVGMYYVFRTASSRVFFAVVIVLAAGFPTTMVVAREATMDSPAFGDEHPRYAYTESEIAAVHTISEIHPASRDVGITTDHPYKKLFAPLGGFDDITLQVGPTEAVSQHPTVYREYQSTGPVSFAVPGDRPRTTYTRRVSSAIVCPPDRNVAYANEQVKLCTLTDATGGEAP